MAAARLTLTDLKALDAHALRTQILLQQDELSSRNTEIDHLKLLILKLKRMQFGRNRRSLTSRSCNWNCGSKIWKRIRAAGSLGLPTGQIKWAQRLQGIDVWTVACLRNTNPAACPVPSSPDFDLGGSGPNLLPN